MSIDLAKKVGDLAEDLVVQWLTENGQTGVKSANPFDMHKDITHEEEETHIEVKARTANRKYFGFAINRDQWWKLDSVGRLIFVSIPTNPAEPIVFFEAVDKDGCYDVIENFGPAKNAVRMYLMDKMKRLHVITDKDVIKQMYDLSPSSYKDK